MTTDSLTIMQNNHDNDLAKELNIPSFVGASFDTLLTLRSDAEDRLARLRNLPIKFPHDHREIHLLGLYLDSMKNYFDTNF